VFHNPLEEFAAQLDAPRALLLGLVMAHEIGHLLLPYEKHANTGLMRAGWSRTDIELAGRGQLRFSATEAGLIRAKLQGTSEIMAKR
jgi:hypothetical protein